MRKSMLLILKIWHYITQHIFILAPLLVMGLFLFYASLHNLYPFGEFSLAWADVQQQVIPLLNTFKDILSGEQALVYNFHQAGGMSFFGVFFFFLASPFTFLVAFVAKSDMMLFINVLVMLKLMAASASVGFYFFKKYPKLNPLISLSLSVLYAFSAYNLMYYQNIIWLDCMTLFPLLFLSIDSLFDKDKVLPYLVMITFTMIVNYYIGMIEVIFILMFVALLLYLRKREIGIQKKAWHFVLASGIGALLTMAVLFPSLLQYLASARSNSFIESIEKSWFFASYETTIPLFLGLIVLTPFLFSHQKTPLRKAKMIALIFLMIPLLIDPINKVWHFGSYQAFPSRFFFINLFLVIDLASESLNAEVDEGTKAQHIFSLIFISIIFVFLYQFEKQYVAEKIQDLDQYATSLWGNRTSLEALLRYYMVILVALLLIYSLYRIKLVTRKGLSLAIFGFSIIEAMFAFNIYVGPAARSVDSYTWYYQLQDIIQDDSFYRVKTSRKIQHVNDLGAMGYANLGHYTSLTSENYLYTMKKLGYSSYWMEVGAYGGTTFTDAILRNKYTIYPGVSAGAAYQTPGYYVLENEVFPFGLVTSNDLSIHRELSDRERVQMQENIHQALFAPTTELHTVYPYSSLNQVSDFSDETTYRYEVGSSGSINYTVNIVGEQTLYFECFDDYSNKLVEPINQSMRIYLNGRLAFNGLYPEQLNNGTISLGTFTDETVNVRLDLIKSVQAKSFSVFSVDETLLQNEINNAEYAELSMTKNRIEGTYENEEEAAYLFLPFAYTSGIKATVNHKRAEVIPVFSGFTAVKLMEGSNQFQIRFTQPGLWIGVSLSLLGAALLGLYIYLKNSKKIASKPTIHSLSYDAIILVGSSLFAVIYIASIFINVFGQLK